MKKKVLVILAQGFEDIEAVTPIDILRRADISVTVAGIEARMVTGSRGCITLQSDILLSEAGTDYDACVIPGGMPGASNIAASQKATELIQKMHADNKIIAAICAAPAIVLSPLEILKGKKATCYPGMETNFSENVLHSNDPVVVDGTIITSQGVGTVFDFSFALVEALVGSEVRNKVKKAVLMK